MLRILSLGAGVQSSTIALMAHVGDLPPIDHAIFADTQSEPAAVYRQLEWLRGVLSFPVHVVTKGSLRQEILDASAGIAKAWGRPPLFITNPDGSEGMTRRQCTVDYKIDVIQKQIRALAGIAVGSRGPRAVVVEQLFGISLDEAHRMRDPDFRWLRYAYPLIDRRLTRADCLAWLVRHGFPRPPKSACTFCPYHSDRMWRDMQTQDPVSFADAVRVDDALRSGADFLLTGVPYLHRQRIPLRLVDFSRGGQGDLFGDECAGVCGV
jgi:hypothetical protein